VTKRHRLLMDNVGRDAGHHYRCRTSAAAEPFSEGGTGGLATGLALLLPNPATPVTINATYGGFSVTAQLTCLRPRACAPEPVGDRSRRTVFTLGQSPNLLAHGPTYYDDGRAPP